MNIETFYERVKPYVHFSIYPIAIYYALSMLSFLTDLAKVAVVCFIGFELGMFILGCYIGTLRAINKTSVWFDPSQMKICKVSPPYGWGENLLTWATRRDEIE